MGWDVWYNDSDNRTLNGGYYVRDCQTGWWYTGPAWENADYFGDLVLGGSTDVESEHNGLIPGGNRVFQNYPNPFNPNTTIPYRVKERCRVVLKVFNMLGNEAATLVNSRLEPGTYESKFIANDMPSGVYFYRIEMGEFIALKKMILIE
jgi:hypothetical protein